MYWVDHKDHILKVSWHYQGYKQEYEQGYAQWVLHDVLDVACGAEGSYPESFEVLSSFLAEI